MPWRPNGLHHFEQWRGDHLKCIEWWGGEGHHCHRENGPAKIVFHDYSNVIASKAWFLDGVPKRVSKEATHQLFSADGHLIKETWWDEDQELHREDDLPAQIRYNLDGSVQSRLWMVHGRGHRDGGLPAYVSTSGRTHYKVDGEWCRPQCEGPVYIDEKGNEFDCVNSKLVPRDQETID